ncbi:MAG TPA: aspartate-semialdehyde dehydrogenase [Candidatus Binataceae bacterium]
MANGNRIAVVGATGAVGQTTLKLLHERKFPVSELRAFASERSVGRQLKFGDDSVSVELLKASSFKGIDFAFFSAGASQSREFAPAAVKAGAVVVDKSSAFRMDREVPLVVPEINGAAAKRHKGIVACPNCTTIVTVMPLKPLHDAGRLRRVVATSFQAVSGAGVNGIAELRAQTLAWSRGEPLEAKFFQHQIAFNLIPHIDKFVEGGYTGEEIKLVGEIRKILDLPELLISPTTVRVPVFTAHSISVNAETEQAVGAARAREVFASFPGLRVYDDPAENRYPMPIVVEGQDDCFVGRIRDDLSCPNALNFWVVGDQLRKGAALNGIQIAELLIR